MLDLRYMKIGIQGEKFSWHYLASQKLYGKNIEILFYKEFSDVFRAQDKGDIDFGLVAIENSVYGSIVPVYQELSKRNYFINGEVKLQINQCLLALPSTKLEEITDVYSHPVALNQCHAWLENNLPQADQHAYFDTAMSAIKVSKSSDKISAIGPAELANDLDLQILARDINVESNYTRFISFSNSKDVADDANKTSIILTTSHKEGALYDALGCFAKEKINLTKLESHPVTGRAWEYQFYIDLDCRFDQKKFKSAEKNLINQGAKVQVIGCFLADDML